jgi:hypothetical protein
LSWIHNSSKTTCSTSDGTSHQDGIRRRNHRSKRSLATQDQPQPNRPRQQRSSKHASWKHPPNSVKQGKLLPSMTATPVTASAARQLLTNSTAKSHQPTSAVKKQASPRERRSLDRAISRLIRLSTQPEQPQDGSAEQPQLLLPPQQWCLNKPPKPPNKRQWWEQPQEDSSLAQPHEGSEEAAQPHEGSAGAAAAGAAHDGSAAAGAAQPHDGSAGAAQEASFAQPHDGSDEQLLQLLSPQHLCLNKPRHALAWLSSATDTPTTTAKQTAARTMKLRFISILHEKNVGLEAHCPSTYRTFSTKLFNWAAATFVAATRLDLCEPARPASHAELLAQEKVKIYRLHRLRLFRCLGGST